MACVYRVLPLEPELAHGQGLCRLQLLDLLHFLIVPPDLLADQNLHTPARTGTMSATHDNGLVRMVVKHTKHSK